MKLKCEKSDLCRTFHSPLKCSLIRVSKSPETLFRADMFPACLLGGSTDTVDEERRKKKKKKSARGENCVVCHLLKYQACHASREWKQPSHICPFHKVCTTTARSQREISRCGACVKSTDMNWMRDAAVYRRYRNACRRFSFILLIVTNGWC